MKESFPMNKFALSSLLTLTTAATLVGCQAAGSLLGNQTELLKSTLGPVCVKQVDERNLLPEELKKVVTTQEICDCAIEKTTQKVSSDLGQIPELLQNTDKQIEFVIQLSTECATEIAREKLKDPAKVIADLLKKNDQPSPQ